MENINILEPEYSKYIESNPEKKFFLYLRTHPNDKEENVLKEKLIDIYGQCKELPKERLIIFLIDGDKVKEFVERLNILNSRMYLSFIQSEDEISNFINYKSK